MFEIFEIAQGNEWHIAMVDTEEEAYDACLFLGEKLLETQPDEDWKVGYRRV